MIFLELFINSLLSHFRAMGRYAFLHLPIIIYAISIPWYYLSTTMNVLFLSTNLTCESYVGTYLHKKLNKNKIRMLGKIFQKKLNFLIFRWYYSDKGSSIHILKDSGR